MLNSVWTMSGAGVNLAALYAAPPTIADNPNYLSNSDKITLIAQYAAELATKTSLDASASAISVSSVSYNNAVAAINTTLTTAGAPSSWATTWPDGTTFGPATGIKAALSSDWTAIASTRAALQSAITVATQSAAISTAETYAAAQAAAAAAIVTPSVVSSLPTLPATNYPSGALVWDTTDGNLYRNSSGTWTLLAVNANSLAANSITAGKIAAGAIGATQIAAGAITSAQLTTGQLFVGGAGSTPVEFVVEDASSVEVAEIGKFGSSRIGPWGNAYGGWFKNLGIGGPNSAAPSLYVDNSGNMYGANGAAIDYQGNVRLKNIVNMSGVTVSPTVSSSGFADLPELGTSNTGMTIATKGNPCLIATSLAFYAATSGGTVGGVSDIGWTPSSFTLTTSTPPDAPSVSISISSGGGSGAGAGVSWTIQPVSGSIPPTQFTYTPTLSIAAGSGYTSAPTATVVISGSPAGSGYTDGTTTHTCSLFVATPAGGIPIQIVVLMDSTDVIGPFAITTDSMGNATFSGMQLVFPNASSHSFEVQAKQVSGSATVKCLNRSFQLVELG